MHTIDAFIATAAPAATAAATVSRELYDYDFLASVRASPQRTDARAARGDMRACDCDLCDARDAA